VHRESGQANALDAVEKTLAKLIKEVESRKKREIAESSTVAASSAGTTLFSFPEASFLQPRGKFSLELGSTGLLLTTAKAEVAVASSWSNIISVLRFPKARVPIKNEQG
jgi:hypothetical protein